MFHFTNSDQSFFLPLMQQTERHLGRKPRFGALDKAYDAFYVHEYFHLAGGFAIDLRFRSHFCLWLCPRACRFPCLHPQPPPKCMAPACLTR